MVPLDWVFINFVKKDGIGASLMCSNNDKYTFTSKKDLGLRYMTLMFWVFYY